MSGVSPSPAEQHLGDRLAALVDGELSHDVRERVLAHLATCPKCKAEADAQRRLKSLFVESAPPPLSAGLLARLQGLPGGSLDGSSGPPGPGGSVGSGGSVGPGGSVRPVGSPGADPFASFGYAVPVSPREGFRIHEVGRSRRRFAFVAAGAVSLAAIALGGSLPIDAVDPNARGEVPASQPGPAVSVADAAVRDRMPSPGGVPSLRTPGPQPPVTPSAPASARPVSLSR
ncbi:MULTISPECIES: zf-HC2 domain-containing protein [unclassified Streptomyces]|uniref:zf-HC2 domain-containing protein n=1 Tax=unclassified Streptomyces TaxID=2593676 RepID=UPI001BE87953|nr:MULTISPECIES: zf-HC2 domain-containing protein [unclassified Streptomyces]MBT2402996.1 zf-HC2 domain-containing protein [Streptomyces sp. ISL-21]MBT2455356.1 zf-HC2 domain-containing protein [Streptomyces sp. ISL-86]MBT2609649.1 zf-HC2 domain-containing protein [Streptomyces sp. ISL-87]